MVIKADIRQLKELQKQLNQLQENKRKTFIEAAAKELAARLLGKVIPRTPVGVYPPDSGRVGGTLRRGWTGGKNQNAVAYARSLPVIKEGNTYTIVVKNPVEYASFVEYGHRQQPGRYVHAIGKRLKKSWVEGRFFLTKSENELEGEALKIVERKIQAELDRIFKQ